MQIVGNVIVIACSMWVVCVHNTPYILDTGQGQTHTDRQSDRQLDGTEPDASSGAKGIPQKGAKTDQKQRLSSIGASFRQTTAIKRRLTGG